MNQTEQPQAQAEETEQPQAQAEETAAIEKGNREDRKRAVRRGRRRRDGSFDASARQKLHVDPGIIKDEYEYRWVNDKPGRVNSLYAQDWDVVQSDGEVSEEADKGLRRQAGVSNGRPLYAVLMRKPKDLYEQDQKTKQSEIDEIDKSLKAGDPAGKGAEAMKKDKAYVPDGGDGIKIE